MSSISSVSMRGTASVGPGSVFQDRLQEEQWFRTTGPPELPLDVIRHVWLSFLDDRDLCLLFENGERRFALVVHVEDPAALGWKECQAVVDALRLTERGTRVTNESFKDMFTHFKTKYGRTEGPTSDQGILLGTIFPNRGTLQTESPSVLKSTGIAFDRDGDVLLRSQTFGGQRYAVYVELALKGPNQRLPSKKQALYKLDSRVLVDMLTLLEVGDPLPPQAFLAALADARDKYNFLSVDRYDGGALVAAAVLASRARSPDPMPPILARARELKLQRPPPPAAGVEPASPPPPPRSPLPGASRPARAPPFPPARPTEPVAEPGLPACPYPGVRYIRRLKKSGQACVYAGRYRGKDVAVKLFMEDDREVVFKRELTMLLKMDSHPNVVKVLDFWEAPEPCVVMELVNGEDMMDHLEYKGAMSAEDTQRVASALADGINHLHRNGIVHRDLKSSNILIDENGAPIIIDLGLGGSIENRAKPKGGMNRQAMVQTFVDSRVMRTCDNVLGTILWVAPEMVTSYQWGKATDVYAFGIMMWEMLSGRVPFMNPDVPEEHGPTPNQLLFRIASGERPDLNYIPPDAPKELIDLMKMCWAQDPSKRPNMRQVVDTLAGRDPVAIFKRCDSNGDNSLGFAEFVSFLEEFAPGQVQRQEMHSVFSAIDVNKDGDISLAEFIEFWRQVDTFGLQKALANCTGRRAFENREAQEWLQS